VVEGVDVVDRLHPGWQGGNREEEAAEEEEGQDGKGDVVVEVVDI
jgi:hypothetical protein